MRLAASKSYFLNNRIYGIITSLHNTLGLSIFLLLLINGCTISDSGEPSVHPEGVPPSALWTGGSDGGVYVLVLTDEQSQHQLQIFYEHGEVWYQGPATLSPDNVDLKLPIEQDDLKGWDGSTLFLSNQGRLTISK